MSDVKYRFIHPTKTGGSAVQYYFLDNYGEYISGKHHDDTCKMHENPIVIFREPYDRFCSMYRYWKTGSKHFYPGKWKYRDRMDRDIDYFAKCIEDDKTEILHDHYLWDVHFSPQKHWFDCEYDKIIVLEYCNDLQRVIYKLLSSLDIPNKNIPLPIVNKTIQSDEHCNLSARTQSWFKDYFREDIDIYNKIKTNSKEFKLIIRS